MAFTLNLVTMNSQVMLDGSIGQVVGVRFIAQKSVDDINAHYNMNMDIPLSYAPAQIPFDTVTEADIDAWIRDLFPESAIESELDTRIGIAATPQTTSQRPWQSNYPLWAIPVAYAVGDIVIYRNEEGFDIGYECVQAHTSQASWVPALTPALWKVFVDASAGVQEWIQPTGAQDAYDFGVQVWWDAGAGIHLWTSEYSANTWEPGLFGWTDEGSYTP